MAILVELEGAPQYHDVIVYEGGKWQAINKAIFLGETQKEIAILAGEIKESKENIKALEAEISAMKNALAEFANGVNETLSKHHDVLQILVGGDK